MTQIKHTLPPPLGASDPHGSLQRRWGEKDIQIEYPPPDNTQGEHMRMLCDVTHVPSGIRARGRGRTSEMAKIAAVAKLKVVFGYTLPPDVVEAPDRRSRLAGQDIDVPAEQRHFTVPTKSADGKENPQPDGVD